MSKIVLTDLSSLRNETTAIAALNNNFGTLEDAFDNTLSRNGASPNQMDAELDMNSNRIINLGAPVDELDAVRYQDIQDLETLVNDLTVDGITYDTAVDVTASQIGLVATAVALATKTINANIDIVRTGGYSTIGDGGAATYKRISTPSPVKAWHIQSGDGAYWEICDNVLNPLAIGAKGDNVTNNDTAFAAITDACVTLGLWDHVHFPSGMYRFSSSWDLDEPQGALTISGEHSGGVSHGRLGSCLIFTGASGSAIDATEARGIVIENLGITYSSSSFNGILLDISCALSIWNKNVFRNLQFYSQNTGPFYCTCIYAYRSVDNSFENIRFSHAEAGVIGAFNGTSGANSAANSFYHCDFVYVNTPIANPGLNWTFHGCRFEPNFDGGPAGVYSDSFTDTEGLSFHGCSFSDCTEAGTWIDVNSWFGGGCFGCTFSGDIDAGAAAVNAVRAATFFGTAFIGCLFSGVTNSIVSTNTGSQIAFIGNSHPNAMVSVANPTQFDGATIFAGNNTPEVLPWGSRVTSYAKANLPNPINVTGVQVYVTDEVGGATMAFSDGTNWRRMQDRVIVS
jgi:hypothetical protein